MEKPQNNEQQPSQKEKRALECSNYTILTEQEVSKQSLEKSQRKLLQTE